MKYKRKAGTVNFKGAFNEYYFPFKHLPFVYLLDNDVLSRDNFVEVWNDNFPENPINNVDETYDNEYFDEAYYEYLHDFYKIIIDDVEEYINTLDLPSDMLIEIIDGEYEGVQLYVNGNDQGIIDMFENEWYELHKNELADDEDFYINGLSEEHQKSLDKYIESRWPELEKQIAEYLRQIAKNFGWNIVE